jgi:UDP-N-acetylmuramoyl-L-alanyl-D-glutamate--2,6-diaminopimelate ligase
MQDLSRQMMTVGVTGTNGKTSTTRWTAACLARLARPVAQVTTLGAFLDDEPFDATSDFEGFIKTMRAGIERGGRFAAIETTSEALARGFANEWPCTVGVFTNLTRDHFDAHGSAEHYLASKAQLFVHLLPGGTAVLNVADPASKLLAEVLPSGVRVVGYATESRGAAVRHPELRALAVQPSWSGTRIVIEGSGELSHAPRALRLRAIGEVYAENALAALAAALVSGVARDDAVEALEAAPPVPGRFEVIDHDARPRVVVDYAHTPDALVRTLATARGLCEGELWVVLGAGGERDQGKRATMGSAASEADHIVLTSDNPRREHPAQIVAAIRDGITGSRDVRTLLDRQQAIRNAVTAAGENDVLVIAGKGHEKVQIVAGQARPFDDVAEARAALAGRGGGTERTPQGVGQRRPNAH